MGNNIVCEQVMKTIIIILCIIYILLFILFLLILIPLSFSIILDGENSSFINLHIFKIPIPLFIDVTKNKVNTKKLLNELKRNNVLKRLLKTITITNLDIYTSTYYYLEYPALYLSTIYLYSLINTFVFNYFNVSHVRYTCDLNKSISIRIKLCIKLDLKVLVALICNHFKDVILVYKKVVK